MKTVFLFSMLVASVLVAQSAVADMTCSQASGGMAAYTIKFKIDEAETNVVILQSSRVGRYRPIVAKLQRTQFTAPIQKPEMSCIQTSGRKQRHYSIQFLLQGDVLQVLQSSMNAMYQPLQYKLSAPN